LLPTVPWN